MEQSPGWEANRFSAGQVIPRISWEPKVHYLSHELWLFRNMIRFYGEELLAPRPTPKVKDNPLSASATSYSVYSQLPSILEAVPSSATRVRAILWWQEPNYHDQRPYLIKLYFIITLKTHVWSIYHNPETRRCTSVDIVTGLRAGKLKKRCLVSCRGQHSLISCIFHAGSGVQAVCIEWNVWCFLSQSQAVGSCSRPLSSTQFLVSNLKLHGNKPPLTRLSL